VQNSPVKNKKQGDSFMPFPRIELKQLGLIAVVSVLASLLTITLSSYVLPETLAVKKAGSDFTPTLDDTYNLGTSKLRWKSVQLGPGTLFMQDRATGKQAALTISAGALQIDGATAIRLGGTQVTKEGIIFPDGSIVESGANVGSTSGYAPQNICIETLNSVITMGTCASRNVSGVTTTILMKK
jgi:hypothetical protein